MYECIHIEMYKHKDRQKYINMLFTACKEIQTYRKTCIKINRHTYKNTHIQRGR